MHDPQMIKGIGSEADPLYAIDLPETDRGEPDKAKRQETDSAEQ